MGLGGGTEDAVSATVLHVFKGWWNKLIEENVLRVAKYICLRQTDGDL